ncbi:hypothetical protein [Alistipes putredinis]|uniref:hypothetical protein n=1 Tax=Alistipes putredinis TaxID=28117 RepID=UPI003AF06598
MKTLFKSLMLIAVAAMTFTSCSKDNGIDNGGSDGPMVQLTLRAGNPEMVAAISDSRTELIDGTPYWSVGDKIGVSTNGTSTNYMFTNTAEEAAKTTTFTGSTTVSSTIYAYYPYTSNGIGKGGADGATGAKIDIPVNQNPSATSFDGKADLLVGKPLTLAAEGTTVADLQFARVGGIVKVVLKDNSTDKKLSGQHVSTLSVTTDGTNYLAGRVLLDVVNGKLYEPYYNQSNSVTTNYTAETQYEINGTNAAFLSVYPRTLESGSKLTIEASTEGYSIKKEITLTDLLEILAGKVTTLNITLTDENITASASGLTLPFKDDFAWVNELSGTAALTIDQYPSNANQVALYSATAYTYPEAPALKLGSSKQRGFFTTADLDLSQAFTVIVRAKTYSSDESALQVTAGETIKTSDNLTADYKYYAFEFEAQSAKSKVEVEVTGKRGYIIDFQVVAGHSVALPPVLTITSPTTVTALGAGETLTMTYTLENPEAGTATPTASTTDSWIHDFNYGTAGEISFVVDKNEGEKRTGTINISYNDLPAQQITVNQAAGGGGSKEYTVTINTDNFKALKEGAGYAVFNGDHTFMATASDGSEYEVVFNTNQFMIQSGKIQGQKNSGAIYNQTNLGKITSVVITTLSGPVTMYEGPAKQPKDTSTEGADGTYTFSGDNGFMQLTAGSKTVTFDSMTITFTL